MNRHRRHKISSRNIQDSSSFTINSTTANTIDHNGGIMSRLCGSHINTTIDPNNSSLDESQWYTWTRIQTIQWFTQQLTMTNNDINDNSNSNNNNNIYGGGLQRDGLIKTNLVDPAELEEEQDRIVAILTPHRITGNVLDMLDVSQLVALGVPYGIAAHLSNSIAHLIEKYPTPLLHSVNKTRQQRKIGSRNDHQHLEGIVYDDENPNSSYLLDLHDDEYNSLGRSRQQVMKKIRGGGSHDEEIQMQQQQQRHPVSSQHEMDIDHQDQHQYQQHHESITPEEGGMTDELHQQLNDVMKERFGLELPKLKAADFYAATQLLSGKESNRMSSHPLATNITPNTDARGNAHGNGNGHINTNQPRSDSSIGGGGGGGSSPNILDNMLDGMPPHLREIAKRRPDLMEKILNQKQGQVIQQNPHATTMLPMVTEGRGNDDDDDDNDEGEQDEEVHLNAIKFSDPKTTASEKFRIITCHNCDSLTMGMIGLALPYLTQAFITAVSELIQVAIVGHQLGSSTLSIYIVIDLFIKLTTDIVGSIIISGNTMISQIAESDHGRSPYKIGTYLQLSIVFYVIGFLPLLVFWSFCTKDILLYLGNDPSFAELGQQFAIPYTFSVLVEGTINSDLFE